MTVLNATSKDGRAEVRLDLHERLVSARYRDADGNVAIDVSRAFPECDAAVPESGMREQGPDRAMVVDSAEMLQRRLSIMPSRLALAVSYFTPKLYDIAQWLVASRENTNFTYDLSEKGFEYLARAISLATQEDTQKIRAYMKEPAEDEDLITSIIGALSNHELRHLADDFPRFGRRLGWYAAVRAMKPKIVVETGVDKGLGSVLLCSALKRNAEDGMPGYYYGTDINPKAGFLLNGPYKEYGEVIYGDSLESLTAFDKTIDIFINDSDHSANYESSEYDCIEEKLGNRAIILGDNSHVTDALMKFADRTGRKFLFCHEEPTGHWYPGAGIGIAF